MANSKQAKIPEKAHYIYSTNQHHTPLASPLIHPIMPTMAPQIGMHNKNVPTHNTTISFDQPLH